MTMPNVMEMIAQLGPGSGPGPGPGPGPGSGPGPSPYHPHSGQHPSGNGGEYPGAGNKKCLFTAGAADVVFRYLLSLLLYKVRSILMMEI